MKYNSHVLNLAVVQIRPELGEVEKNLSKVLELLKHVKPRSLVVLPEMWQCGFDYGRLYKHAQSTQWVIEEVKKLSLERSLVIVGTYPTHEGEGIYNTGLAIGYGEILGVRHKIKLFPIYDEPKYFRAGTENPVFDTPNGKLGVLICYELRFPQLSWELRENGAHLIAVPSMWGAKRKEHLVVLSRARAIETQSFLLLSNAWGKVGQEEYAGCSAIYSPWGEVLCFSERGESIMQVETDKKEVEVVRRYIPL